MKRICLTHKQEECLPCFGMPKLTPNTDNEINEAVARKLGWTYEKPPEISYDPPFPWTDPSGKPHMFLPDYCHDIKAAWEVVEKIEWFCLYKEHDGSGWSVWDMAGTEEAQIICVADTAPMAICLAFLKLP